MNKSNKVLLIFIFVLFIVCITLWVLYFRNKIEDDNAYSIINKWNSHIIGVRNSQNEESHMSDANECGVKSVERLNSLIQKNHNKILQEVEDLMDTGYTGLPMSEMDSTQNSLTGGSKLWSPIWVKFIDTWAGTAKKLPTLKKIVKDVGDDILLLHVSVFKPGASLPYHTGISKGVWRYHYGLRIPEGDVGLEVEGKRHEWENRKGFIWDDTLPHKAWNNTDETRLIIFADVHRNMKWYKKKVSKYVHSLIQSTKHVKEIQAKIERQGLGDFA